MKFKTKSLEVEAFVIESLGDADTLGNITAELDDGSTVKLSAADSPQVGDKVVDSCDDGAFLVISPENFARRYEPLDDSAEKAA